MASRRLVPASVHESLLGIASDIGSLERNYVLPDEDLGLIATRRRPDNRLGLAVHIALLRHPGQGWLDGIELPAPLVAWLAEQIGVSSDALTRYGVREPTRSEHRRLAIHHLGLRVFVRAEHMRAAILLAARGRVRHRRRERHSDAIDDRVEDATLRTSESGDSGAYRPGRTRPGTVGVRCSHFAAYGTVAVYDLVLAEKVEGVSASGVKVPLKPLWVLAVRLLRSAFVDRMVCVATVNVALAAEPALPLVS